MKRILMTLLCVGLFCSCGVSKKEGKEKKEQKIVVPEEITPEERTSISVQVVEE